MPNNKLITMSLIYFASKQTYSAVVLTKPLHVKFSLRRRHGALVFETLCFSFYSRVILATDLITT